MKRASKPAAAIPPPRPIAAVCAKMCERCPFRPDGTGYAQEFLAPIADGVARGHPFYCHETVIFDKRTKFGADGETPTPKTQPHFELCRGGHEHRMKVWRDQIIEMGMTPGDVPAPANRKTP